MSVICSRTACQIFVLPVDVTMGFRPLCGIQKLNLMAVFQPDIGLSCVDCILLMLLKNRFHVLLSHSVQKALHKLKPKVFHLLLQSIL